jgi:hypothetical protein
MQDIHGAGKSIQADAFQRRKLIPPIYICPSPLHRREALLGHSDKKHRVPRIRAFSRDMELSPVYLVVLSVWEFDYDLDISLILLIE